MKNKKRFGDRKDGVLLRNVDSMHFIMPIIYPNRCDNEAFITETMDLTNLDAFLEKKNADDPEYKYNLFQCLVTAALKTISLRSKMNRFIANGNMYQRNEVSAAFTVKQVFTDDGDEVLAFIHSKPEFTLKDIHDEIGRQLKRLRQKDAVDPSTDIMNIFNKIPRVISKTAVKFVCFLDKHGWVPSSFIETDPYYSSVVLSNLGSLHLQSGYHHMTNWGTTSVFITVGEAKTEPVLQADGTVENKHQITCGFIIDERVADGFYYAKTIKLYKFLIEHPELLDRPLNEKLGDDLWNQIK